MDLTDGIRSCAIGFLNGGIGPLPVFRDLVHFQQDLGMADAVALCFAFAMSSSRDARSSAVNVITISIVGEMMGVDSENAWHSFV